MALGPMASTLASAAATNLIANPGVETPSSTNPSLPADWEQDSWGTNTETFSYDSADTHSGNYGIGVNMTSYTSGDAKWDFNPVNVTAGNTYLFSDYYEATVPTDVTIQYSDASGDLSYVDLGEVAASPTTWGQVNDTFTVPANQTSLTIFHLINSVGWLNTDDYSLTTATPVPTLTITSPTAGSTVSGSITISSTTTNPSSIVSVQFTLDGTAIGSPITISPYSQTWNSASTTNGTHSLGAVITPTSGPNIIATPVNVIVNNTNPPGGNLIPNPTDTIASFTNANLPQDWNTDNWGSNTVGFKWLGAGSGYNGSQALQVSMTSYTSGDAKWDFTPVNITAGGTYNFSDYYESSVPTDVTIQYNNASGTDTYVDLGAVAASPSTWAKVSDTFTVPTGETQLTVFHLVNSVGSLLTSDFSLTTATPLPTLTITSPTAGSTVSGSVTISSTTTNSSSIASVQYTLDGVNIGSALTASPFNLTWNSATTTNGTHSIGAVVTPTSGPNIIATPISVLVNNTNPVGGNLIPNPTDTIASSTNANLPQNWSTDNWGSNTVGFKWLGTGSGYNGSQGLQVNMTSYTSGDAKWDFTPVNITAGGTYNFSDWYEASVPTDVVIQYNNASGADTYVDLGAVVASPTAWTKVSDTFTVPTGETQLTVFHLIEAVGSLTTSDFSLTAAAPVPTISITSPTVNSTLSGNTTLTATTTNASSIASVQFTLDGTAIGSPITTSPYSLTWNSASTTNGGHAIGAILTPVSGSNITAAPVNVEITNAVPLGGNLIPNPMDLIVSPTSSTTPQDWLVDNWGTNTASFTYGAAGSGYNGSRALEVNMTSYTSGDGKWGYTPQTFTPDTQYKYSEYYETNVPTEVDTVFNMTDGTIEYQMIGLPAPASTWTNFTTEFVVPQGTASITIYHFIERVGYLNTSDFSLTPYTPVGFKRPIVTLTFDDGYNNMYTYALPILQADGFTSTQFIITNDIGKSGYMTSTQVKAMYTAGNEIASHTVTHTDLTTETASRVTTELSQSQTTLKTLTGAAVTDFAYPYGEYNSAVTAQVKTYYSSARGVEDGLNSMDNFNAYDLKVQNVFDYTTTAQIADWIAQAKATNTWLILCYHSADPNVNNVLDGGLYNVTPTQLTSELAAVKSSGVAVETMSQALAEVEAQL